MKVKHLVMIVNGKHKAEILKQVLDSPITDELPATVLKLHPNVNRYTYRKKRRAY